MQNKICVGTMLWGSRTDAHEAHNIINTALDNGIDFFDTAQKYPTFPYSEWTHGVSELILGDWIRANGKKLRVSTKLKSPIIPEDISEYVDNSLLRLGIDCIDYCHLHWPSRPHYHFRKVWMYDPTETDTQETLDHFDQCSEVLNNLQCQGKIKHICMSNETAWGITQWAQRLNLDYVQQEYSLLHRLFELDVAEACHHNNIKLLAWSPLAGGLLTGKYTDTITPENSRRSYGGLGPRDNVNVWEPIRRYKNIAQDASITLTQMSIAWVMSSPLLEAIILGVTNAQQLEENISTIVKLDEETLFRIRHVYQDHPLPF